LLLASDPNKHVFLFFLLSLFHSHVVLSLTIVDRTEYPPNTAVSLDLPSFFVDMMLKHAPQQPYDSFTVDQFSNDSHKVLLPFSSKRLNSNYLVQNTMAVHETTTEEDDDDSLFGSPPPQFEGRASSPALALPTATSTYKNSSSALNIPVSVFAGIQNVGTIALTGSQLDSELPIHPLALSLNHGMVPRPPALPQKQSQAIAASTTPSAVRSDCIVAPSTADPPRSSTARKRSRPSQPRFQSEPATEPALEFSLPDPSAPPPVHFLRSQENLLGKAGRVGGITTTLPQPRGSTPSNPILIGDDDDAPIIGRRNGSKSRESSIDPTKLAQPSNEEIVSVLVGQRDIFPVLESILKLIANGAQPKPRLTGFERRLPGSSTHECSMGPPAKKRKLNRVPAGAADWDVPFPFADGEGPTAYHQNWERDRGKQLIAELIKLIKVASRKAAAKKYIAQQIPGSEGGGEKRYIQGHYRPETALYGSQLESGIMSTCGNLQPMPGHPSQKTSLDSPLEPAIPPSIPSLQEEIQQSLDQLLSSFMESSVESADFMSTRDATDISQSPNSSVPPTAMFESWMNILNAFPIDSDGAGAETQVLSSESNMTTPLSVRSTPGIDDFGLLSIPPDLDVVLGSTVGTPPPVPTPSTSTLFDFTSISPTLPSTSVQDLPSSHSVEFDDFAFNPNLSVEPLDPLFLVPAATGTGTFANLSSAVSEDPTRPSSPLRSAGSESQAMTPTSASWELSLPDILSCSNGDGEGQGMWRDSLWSMFDDVAQHGLSYNSGVDLDLGRNGFGEKDDFLSLRPPVRDKGKAKEVVEPSSTTKMVETGPQIGPVTQSVFNALLSTKTRDELLACITGSASSTPISATAKPMKRSNETDSERSARQRRKEDIIRRAKERRQEIQEDLNNIKRQLWETTVEQAALIQLTKKLEVDGSET